MDIKIRKPWLIIAILVVCLLGNMLTVSAQDGKVANSLLWQISGPELPANSYLFGTMHSKDNRVFQFSDTFDACFDSASAFAMEILLDADVYSALFSMMIMDEDYSIRDHITEEEYNKIDTWLKSNYGFKLTLFERIKPIFLYVMVTQAGMGADNEKFLDEYLYHKAKDQEKELFGIEKIEEQVAVFDAIPLEEQFKMLLEGIDNQKKETKMMDKMLKAYEKEDLNTLMKMINKESPSEDLNSLLIDNRNEIMATRIDSMIQGQSVFIAIGAGHLAGEKGVITLLREKGYSVTALKE